MTTILAIHTLYIIANSNNNQVRCNYVHLPFRKQGQKIKLLA